MSRSAREERQSPSPTTSVQAKAGGAVPARSVQLKESLRGQDFAAQEAALAPGADLGAGVVAGPPVQRSAAPQPEVAAGPPMVDGKPVQMKGLMSNITAKGGWRVTGVMPNYPLTGGWHGSIFRTGAKGPKDDGLFFDGFHLTYDSAPEGRQPHIFFDHAGGLDQGTTDNHGQTKRYKNQLAGQPKQGTGGRWPGYGEVENLAKGKASAVASTLGKNLTSKEEEEIEAQHEKEKQEKAQKEKEERELLEAGKWLAIEKDPLCTPLVLSWMKRAGVQPNELRWFGDPAKGKARRDSEDLKFGRKPMDDAPTSPPEVIEEVRVEETIVSGGETVDEGTDESVVEDTPEPTSEVPTLEPPKTEAPTTDAPPKSGGPKGGTTTPKGPTPKKNPPKSKSRNKTKGKKGKGKGRNG